MTRAVLALVVTTAGLVTLANHRTPARTAVTLAPVIPLTVRASRGERRLPLRPSTPALRKVPGEGAIRHRRPSRPAGAAAHLNWHALALCESSDNPRAVDPSGTYFGLFQADAPFWRRYGGLAFAKRPDRATPAEQLVVAERGYEVQGRAAWPYCGRFL